MYNDKYNAPDTYTDMDGQSKNFTHINYSKKSKMSFQMKEEQDLQELLKADKLRIQEEILNLPASMFPMEFQDFIIRDIPNEKIIWNESMIRDEGTPFTTLLSLKTLTSNRLEHYGPKAY